MKTKAKSGNTTAGRNARSTGFTMAMGKAEWDALVAKAQGAGWYPGWRTPKGKPVEQKAAKETKGLKSAEAICPAADLFRVAFAEALQKLRGQVEQGDEQEARVADIGHLEVVVLVRRIGA